MPWHCGAQEVRPGVEDRVRSRDCLQQLRRARTRATKRRDPFSVQGQQGRRMSKREPTVFVFPLELDLELPIRTEESTKFFNHGLGCLPGSNSRLPTISSTSGACEFGRPRPRSNKVPDRNESPRLPSRQPV